jgi:adenine-specific DNA-methyltransferase
MAEQLSLTNDDIYLVENEDYLTQQLITYIGNKRSLLTFIGDGVYEVTRKLGKKKLDVFDVFSGSGAVARYFKQFSTKTVCE